jgi:uncharacterized protein (TIGR00730 family)
VESLGRAGLSFVQALAILTAPRRLETGWPRRRGGTALADNTLRTMCRACHGVDLWARLRRDYAMRHERDEFPGLSYRDQKFLDSEEARPIRILAEYLEPLRNFRNESIGGTIVFFGSARLREEGPLGHYYTQARELARLCTLWSASLPRDSQRLVVCSGGAGGIMEAANRGARDAGGRTIGLNIGLPHEQRPNPYITPGLSFEFHYFFMRKLWFAHLARAIIAFPGGFGTIEEMMEMLTLAQTRKLERKLVILLYGSSYWQQVIDFDALVRHGMISAEDRALFQFVDDPAAALSSLQRGLEAAAAEASSPFTRSVAPPRRGGTSGERS